MSYVTNHSAFVLIPEAPMLAWVQEVNDEDLTMDILFDESEVYLVPSFETDDELDKALEKFWPRMFDIELTAWSRDKNNWPKNRSFEMFQQWFKLTPFNGIVDWGPRRWRWRRTKEPVRRPAEASQP